MPLSFVYTPVHGVGLRFATEAFKRFGFQPFHVVHEQVNLFNWQASVGKKKSKITSHSSQANPDPDFPSVDLPNPEEGESVLASSIFI